MPNRAVTLLIISFIAALISSNLVFARAADDACSAVELIVARGSGQRVGVSSEEMDRFKSGVGNLLIKSGLSHHFYELGTESYNANQYPAVNVGDWTNWNAVGAKLSSGMANDYGKSVKQGTEELKDYLVLRRTKCPDARIILAGYSQGAQVMGQVLPELSLNTLDHIDHVALFGDPKLYLTEGRGILPPACNGKGLSAWRRDVANCYTSEGSLRARTRYAPNNDFAPRIGLWCNKNDYICGSTNTPWDTSGHEKYKDDGGAIDRAVTEAVQRLQLSKIDSASQAEVHNTLRSQGQGAAGTDVMFVLDTTGSMDSQIEASKEFIRQSAAKIKAMNGRVGLVLYRDSTDEYVAKMVSNLQSDTADLLAKLTEASADGGYDDPEAALSALMTAYNQADWRNGATKAAVVVTDATYHDPDIANGYKLQDIVKRSLEIDPVNTYIVTSPHMVPFYQDLADQTAGKVITQTDTIDALTSALEQINSRPVVQLSMSEYATTPGGELLFDVGRSYVYDATITNYDWDFNGDGVFDETTTVPSIKHTYEKIGTNYMQIRARASNGTVGSASAKIVIEAPKENVIPGPPGQLSSVWKSDSSVLVSWKAPDKLSDIWVVYLNDVMIGYVSSETTTIEIDDLDTTQSNLVSVRGVNTANNRSSDFADIELVKSGQINLPIDVNNTSINIFTRMISSIQPNKSSGDLSTDQVASSEAGTALVDDRGKASGKASETQARVGSIATKRLDPAWIAIVAVGLLAIAVATVWLVRLKYFR